MSHKIIDNKYFRRLCIVLTVLPAVATLIFIKVYAVNVPVWDQYELVPIIQSMNDHSLSFNDLWEQHNEHRIFFPKLIMLVLATMSHWDVRLEMLTSWVIAVGSFIIVLKLVNMSGEWLKKKVPIWLPVLLSFVFFSIVQQENWLWGWQLQWFLTVFGILLGTYGVARIIHSPRDTLGLIITIIGTVIASYSLGSGVLLWPIIIGALLYLRIEKERLAIVASSALITISLFYAGYHDPPGSISKLIALHEPLQFFAYIALYLGRPLSYIHIIALIGGVLLGLSLLGIGIYLYKKYKERFKSGLPWFILGSYAIVTAIITAIARLGFGVGQSLSSRYTTLSLLLLVSVIVLIVLNRDIVNKLLKKTFIPVFTSGVVILFALIVSNAWESQALALHQSNRLKDLQTCSHEQSPNDGCYLTAYPDVKLAADRLNYLKKIHWGGY